MINNHAGQDEESPNQQKESGNAGSAQEGDLIKSSMSSNTKNNIN